jgi:hypothetical protein
VPDVTFRLRSDEFSDQVSCDQDAKFWFRLEASEDSDNITDFFLGGFDDTLAGDLLTHCYKTLGRAPKGRIVFGNILSSRPSDATTIQSARERFADYAKQLLAGYGRSLRNAHIERRIRDKVDLVISG